MKRIFALLLVLALALTCAACSREETKTAASGPEEEKTAASGRDTALKEAFDSGKAIRLVRTELPSGDLGEDRAPLDLSPDGKTVLWRTGSGDESTLSVVRDGQTIPVKFTAERGAGDPYGKAEILSGFFLGQLPAWEGFSCSGDGRYFALSHLKYAANRLESPGAAVLDTASGELFLADSMPDGFQVLREKPDEYGIVLANRIDREGKSLYYVMMTSDGYCFCRCPVEGGAREVLCVAERDPEKQPYDITSYTMLAEGADGSWVLTGINGNGTKQAAVARLSVIRFIPSGDTWKTEVAQLGVPYGIYGFGPLCLSASSGYGVLMVQNVTAGQMAAVSSVDNPDALAKQATPWMSITSHLGLIRFRSADLNDRDIWYIRWNSEDPADVSLEPAEELLWAIRIRRGVLYPEEQAEADKRIREDGEDYLPEGFDAEGALAGTNWMRIAGVCMSPDGYYALVCAGNNDTYRLYLADLETMKLRLLEMPEDLDVCGMNSAILASYYPPQMKWNADGTLLIVNGSAKKAEAFRLE